MTLHAEHSELVITPSYERSPQFDFTAGSSLPKSVESRTVAQRIARLATPTITTACTDHMRSVGK
ncbi:protein of unknown function [Bradyrhizobium vignae]|uniref:Uncharacterized protein n=1 Tax=Bradyrhizobium vignae TaxID=1549949 RepID=A0A2U3Q421_9BRAD|nr:protein of unknown function [Bradyrhizobium vignae]